MIKSPRRPGRAVAASLVAALAFGGTLVGLPGSDAPPVVEAAGLEVIDLEPVNENLVVLGSLASRSQQKPVTIAGVGPWTVTGTDSTTGAPYSFVTDYNYSPSTPAHANESQERDDTGITFGSNSGVDYDGRTDVLQLTSGGGCVADNNANGIPSYCSVFGPDVYSEPFDAVVGQSVSFDWAALRVSDDYESYAYLVEVSESFPGSGVFDYGTEASHEILDYGRGTNQSWKTASGPVPRDGSYRFRFVNGTYDKTGGYAIGANMYIDSVVRLGASNPITFDPVGDQVLDPDGPNEVTLNATAASGGTVSFSTISQSSVCTLSGTTVTLEGPGVCSISADEPGDGTTYVPAPTVTRSFTILNAATAPTNSGVPLIQGPSFPLVDGDLVTATEGTWGDGGSPITETTAGFETGDGNPIAGVSGDSCVLVAAAGSSIVYKVTKTNAIGSTVATSAEITDFTCRAPTAPAWSNDTIGGLVAGTPFNDAVAATGDPAPTYSVSAGVLPDGLALDAATGAITGTPTTGGAYSFTILADNGAGAGVTAVFTGTVAGPEWTDNTIGTLVRGEVVADGVAAAGDPAPTYSVSAGTLPAGLALDTATGAITGTPTTPGAYSFTIEATNSAGVASAAFSGTIVDAPVWTDDTIGGLVAGTAFDDGVAATGNPTPTYTVSAGVLPDGLSLNRVSGAITGTPTTGGAYSFTIRAFNGASGSVAFSGTVAGPEWTDNTIGSIVLGQAFNDQVVATGDPAPTYSVSAGSLPAGLALDTSTGAITGTPTTGGAYSFTIEAANADGAASVVFSGTLAPVWTDDTIGPLVAGSVFDDGVVALGDGAPTYRLSAGSLPDGLALNASTGAITGTPTTPGPYSFTVEADFGAGGTLTTAFSGSVAAGTVAPSFLNYDPLTGLVVGQAIPTLAARVIADPAPTFSVTAGALPAGLTLDPSTGAITGTPTVEGAYSFTVTARNSAGTDSVSFSGTVSSTQSPVGGERVITGFDGKTYVVPENSGYVALTPHRVLDTRDTGTKLAAGETYRLAVESDWNVPESAHAVALNVTATEAEDVGYLTVFPCGQPAPPLSSVVNYVAGTDTPNLSLVAPGDNDEICIFSLRSTHLVVDLNGYFADDVDAQLTPQKHVRLVDTRLGTKMSAGDVLEVQVTGDGFAPESATAAVLNVAAVNAEANGFLTLFPCDEEMPLASNVNYEPGSTSAGQAYIKLSPTGTACVFSLQDVDVVVDLNASFSSADAAVLVSITSTRVLDTRGGAPVAAGGIVELQLGGDDGVRDAQAFALNVTATESTGEGFLTLYACDDERPLASSVNLSPERSVSNHSTAIPDATGKVCVYASTATHLVVDVEGIYL